MKALVFMLFWLIAVVLAGSWYLFFVDDFPASSIIADAAEWAELASFSKRFDRMVDSVRIAGANDGIANLVAGIGMVCGVNMIDIVPLLSVESNFDPLITSGKNAVGIGQVMMPTAVLFYESGLIHIDPASNNLFDARINLLFTFTIFMHELRSFRDYERALVAYQGGNRAGRRFGKSPRLIDYQYVDRVMTAKKALYADRCDASI
jgi:hypothetical protein